MAACKDGYYFPIEKIAFFNIVRLFLLYSGKFFDVFCPFNLVPFYEYVKLPLISLPLIYRSPFLWS